MKCVLSWKDVNAADLTHFEFERDSLMAEIALSTTGGYDEHYICLYDSLLDPNCTHVRCKFLERGQTRVDLNQLAEYGHEYTVFVKTVGCGMQKCSAISKKLAEKKTGRSMFWQKDKTTKATFKLATYHILNKNILQKCFKTWTVSQSIRRT